MSDYRIETLAVHAGQEQADSATNARAVPIYQTTSYVFDDTAHAADLFALRKPGNIYTRIMNPTQNVLEERITALEGGLASLATASGAAAVTYTVLNLAGVGDNIVASSRLYGGTYALLAHTLPQFGVSTRFIDPDNPEALASAVDERTKLVFAETIGNPALNVLDVPAWAEAAHSLGLPLILDNTVPTPYLARVFDQGADITVHAATKYLSGNGTVMGGLITDSGRFDWAAHPARFANLTSPDHAYHETVWTDLAGPAAYITRARTVMLRNTGAAIAPMNAFQILLGMETLHLRMERHSSNALEVANFLANDDRVAWVQYPGLAGDRYHEIARSVLAGRGYGGLLSFGVKTGREGGARLIEGLKLFSHLANIGDAKSLAIHSATTTHSQLTESELLGAGVKPEGVRLSIGIENADDLIADLDEALSA